jgi:hypothetical protein
MSAFISSTANIVFSVRTANVCGAEKSRHKILLDIYKPLDGFF